MAITVEAKSDYTVNLYDPRTRSLLCTIGKGRGLKDGNFAEAQFDYAMGLDWASDSNTLYVAEYD